MTEVELLEMLKGKLTIEVGYSSNDPEDSTREVLLFFGETLLSTATL